MNPSDTFIAFVSWALVPARAKRFTELATSTKGQTKIFHALSHDFRRGVKPKFIRVRDYRSIVNLPCLAFHHSVGFGASFATVQEALDRLYFDEDWLILLPDASAGIHRPEGRLDEEMFIVRGTHPGKHAP